ncbi:MAG TPA: type II secretion system F family protein [Candidatus Acidoferrales bacterium]|nr:type II secretion system F family protein [Candidatus Acidoferrales bacterium]
MPEFRFQGVKPGGRTVQGVVSAESRNQARKLITDLAQKNQFKVTDLRTRTTFIYRVRRGYEKPVIGEQKAFSREEVVQALERMDYKVLSVQRKFLDVKPKPPSTEIVTFVRVSADLIREKLPYNEILQLLSNDIQNKTLRETVRDINNDLKQGKDSEQSFIKHERVLGKFTAHMLGLASKSGNMAEIYESTAKFLERQAEFKKSLKSALIMPAITMFILLIAVIYYVAYIFPATAELFAKLGQVPPMTAATLQLSHFLTRNFWWMALMFLAGGIFVARFVTTERGRFLLEKYMIKMPVIGGLIHKQNIEIFCRVFYAMYGGSGENIDVIRLSAEACGNKYMEHQIKTIAIPMMVTQGKGLTESLAATGVFTETAISRFHSGAETGTVRATALQLANYYEKETGYKLKNVIDFVQVIVSLIIMVVMIALTIVSSESALIHPKQPGIE